MVKPFEKDLYDENDMRAKNAVIRFLIKKERLLECEKEDFGPDIKMMCRAGKTECHETEIKHNWTGPWQYKDLHIPYRKQKMAHVENLWFWVLRSDCREAFVVSGKTVFKSKVIHKAVKNMATADQFFSIPIELCTRVRLAEDQPSPPKGPNNWSGRAHHPYDPDYL